MNFVDRYGRLQGIPALALLHPVAIGPLVLEIPDYGGGAGRFFMPESKRVGFVDGVIMVAGDDVIFVNRASGDAGNKALPDARTLTRPQRMRIFVPPVEAAYDGDRARIRRPDAEADAGLTVD